MVLVQNRSICDIQFVGNSKCSISEAYNMSEIQIQSDFFVHMADCHVFSPFILWYYYPIAHFYKYFFILYLVVFILNYVFSP